MYWHNNGCPPLYEKRIDRISEKDVMNGYGNREELI